MKMPVVMLLFVSASVAAAAESAGAPQPAAVLAWPLPLSARIEEERIVRSTYFKMTYWLRVVRANDGTLRARLQGLPDMQINRRPLPLSAVPRSLLLPDVTANQYGDVIGVINRDAWHEQDRATMTTLTADWDDARRTAVFDPAAIESRLERAMLPWHHWTMWMSTANLQPGQSRKFMVPPASLGLRTDGRPDSRVALTLSRDESSSPDAPGKLQLSAKALVLNQVDIAAQLADPFAPSAAPRDISPTDADVDFWANATIDPATGLPDKVLAHTTYGNVDVDIDVGGDGSPYFSDNADYTFTVLDETPAAPLTPERFDVGACEQAIRIKVIDREEVDAAGRSEGGMASCLTTRTATYDNVTLAVTPTNDSAAITVMLTLDKDGSRQSYSGTLERDKHAQELQRTDGAGPALLVDVDSLKPDDLVHAWIDDVPVRDVAWRLRDLGLIDASGIEYLADRRVTINLDGVTRSTLVALLADAGEVDVYDDGTRQAFRPKGTMQAMK